MTISNLSLKLILNFIRSKGKNLRHFYIIGEQEKASELASKITSQSSLGLNCIGIISPNNTTQKSKSNFDYYTHDEAISLLKKTKLAYDFDDIYIQIDCKLSPKLHQLLTFLQNKGKRLILVPSATLFEGFDTVKSCTISDTLMIMGAFRKLTAFQLLCKSAIDKTLSILALIILALPILVIAIIIKTTSKGPVFFSQERIGYDQKIFKMFKFRTMIVNAEKNMELLWTTENDPRVTKIGRFLRRTSIDELPQLFNVLLGNMSLVGPRPERPELADQFTNEYKNYAIRHNTKAGLTGWAQIHGMRGDTSLRKRLIYDYYYIKNWSIWLDLWILILTPLHLIKGSGAH